MPIQQIRALPILLLALLFLSACSILQPVSVAQTPEQRAFALYGTYTILQESAVWIVEAPDAPRPLVRAIQRADAAGKPVIDEMFESALIVGSLRQSLDNPDELADALDELLDYIERGSVAIGDLGRAMNGGEY